MEEIKNGKKVGFFGSSNQGTKSHLSFSLSHSISLAKYLFRFVLIISDFLRIIGSSLSDKSSEFPTYYTPNPPGVGVAVVVLLAKEPIFKAMAGVVLNTYRRFTVLRTTTANGIAKWTIWSHQRHNLASFDSERNQRRSNGRDRGDDLQSLALSFHSVWSLI
ncbi:hypothetical protein M9H77_05181 [Catharanthus roseus]|uniref:Uncharacterized protein n=1 Tax=Catharanthus roseus TaxID=4058 RepID=A0ACC0CGQ9_CATRO|nr:hypothetical protein M9H77_05181 [Catharanthus roseus]